MLKGNNDSALIQRGIHSDYILFHQIWQELVYEKTISSYQYHLMTSLTILKELESVIQKTLDGLFLSDANIQCCKEEALFLLKKDTILATFKKPILNRLQSSLTNSIKTPADKSRLLHQIQYAIREIEPDYYSLVLNCLKEGIKKHDADKIVEYSDMAVSLAISRGWSAQALSKQLRFFHQSNLTPSAQWQKFSSSLKNSSQPYFTVLIRLPFRPQSPENQRGILETLAELSLQIFTRDQILHKYSSIQGLSNVLHADAKFFSITLCATDGFSAANIAIARISEKLNIASFYNLVGAWDLKLVSIVSINTASHYYNSFTAEQLYRTYDYIDSSGQIFQATKHIFSDETKKVLQCKALIRMVEKNK